MPSFRPAVPNLPQDSSPRLEAPKADAAARRPAKRPSAESSLLIVSIALAVAYVATTLVSNVSSTRILNVFGIALDAGTILFPFTFILRDLLHRKGGLHVARKVVILAAAVNGLASLTYLLVSILPPDLSVGPQTEFGAVLGMSWRIVLASVISQLVSELVDSEIYHRWEQRFGSRFIEGRVVASNAVSVPIDSVLFAVIAFAGVLPASAVVGIIFGNLVIKYVISVAFAPTLRLISSNR